MKKLFLVLVIVLITVTLTACNKKEINNKEEINQVSENKKSVVLYFSATGTTENVAKKIANVTNSDIIEIIPEEEYTDDDLNYNKKDTRANKEQNDSLARPKIKNEINLEQYETIYLGYPIWWGTIPKIILTLLDTYDLKEKNIIPFCTSGGSGIETSVNDIKKYNKNLKIDNGKKFSSNVTDAEIKKWVGNN